MTDPARDCPKCARLVHFRDEWRKKEARWHNAPVASFGPMDARLLIVGLAPGLRGANRTGRPFTGDYAGDLLYRTLGTFGFAAGTYGADLADGLRLLDCRITNAVRCVPPQNKPIGAEIVQCRPFLAATLAGMPRLAAVVTLGRIAHESTLRALGAPAARFPFVHGRVLQIPRDGGSPLKLFPSYHCSRYNTNTGRLTPTMFEAVFTQVRAMLDSAA